MNGFVLSFFCCVYYNTMKTSHSFILVALVLLLIIWGIAIPCGVHFKWNPIIYIPCAAAASILVMLASRKGYTWRKRILLKQKTGGAKPCPASSYVYQTRDCYNATLTKEALQWVHPDNNPGCYNMSEALHNSEAGKCSQMPITTQADLDLVDDTHPIEALKMIALAFVGKAGDMTKGTVKATENAIRRGEARLMKAAEESRSRLQAKMEPLTSAIDVAVNNRVNRVNQVIGDTKAQIASRIEQINASDIVNNTSNWLHGDEPNVDIQEDIMQDTTTAADEFTISSPIDDELQFETEPTITNAAQEFGISDSVLVPEVEEDEEEMVMPATDDQNELNIDRLFEVEEKPAIARKQSEWNFSLE